MSTFLHSASCLLRTATQHWRLYLRTVAIVAVSASLLGACRRHATSGSTDGGESADGGESLSTLRVEIPCTGNSTAPYFCASDKDPVEDSLLLPGDEASIHSYAVRVRGVAEFKGYEGATKSSGFCTGGTPDGYGSNHYRLLVADNTFDLNCVDVLTNANNHACYLWDFTLSFQAKGGTKMTLVANPVDDVIDRNQSATTGAPIVIPGIEPAPAAFDGQFFQVDLISM